MQQSLTGQQFTSRQGSRGHVDKLTLEACKRQGIDPGQLDYRPLDDFLAPRISRDIAQLRFEYYERRRQERVKIVEQEKQLIQQEQADGRPETPSTHRSTTSFIVNSTANDSVSSRAIDTLIIYPTAIHKHAILS